MPRKKPFSNKQKKAQLQLKRQKKKQPAKESDERIESVINLDDNIEQQDNPPPKKKEPDNRGRGRNLKKVPGDLRTVFEPESHVVINQRKRDSEIPIKKGLEAELRKKDIELYSTIIDIPKRPEWNSTMSAEEVCCNWIQYNYYYMK